MDNKDIIGDSFRDSIAFARSVTRDDWDAAEIIVSAHQSPYDLMVPLSWLLAASIARLADHSGLTIDEVWQAVIESIDNPEWNEEE